MNDDSHQQPDGTRGREVATSSGITRRDLIKGPGALLAGSLALPSLLGKLVFAARAHAKRLGFAERGYRLVMNCNGDGGQTVYHLHLHLLAGRQLRVLG